MMTMRMQSSSFSKEEVQVPDHFICSLTMDVMREPVVDRFGRSYECAAIFEWLRENGTCPFSRREMGPADLIRNHSLKREIEAWKERRRHHMRGQGRHACNRCVASSPTSDPEAASQSSCCCDGYGYDGDESDSMIDGCDTRGMLFIGLLPTSRPSKQHGIIDASSNISAVTIPSSLNEQATRRYLNVIFRDMPERERSEIGRAIQAITLARGRQQQGGGDALAGRPDRNGSSNDNIAGGSGKVSRGRFAKLFRRRS